MSTFFSRSISEQVNKWRSKNVSVNIHVYALYYYLLSKIAKKKYFSFSFLLLDAVCKEILSDYLQSINFKVQL